MSGQEAVAAVLIVLGALFFTAGTVGLIRFPDVRSGLHALTKADNLGLGLILAGVAVALGSVRGAILLLLTWLLALGAASASAHALARLRADRRPDATRGDAVTTSDEAGAA